VGQWAQENGIPYTSYADLSQNAAVYDLVEEVIARLNGQLPDGLSIRRFVNLHKEFDPDDGEVTRTRKLRRDVINERYGPIIEALYSGGEEIEFEARITYETGQTGVVSRRLTLRDMTAGGD
jgi:long-chain acyl-CoA synthetase